MTMSSFSKVELAKNSPMIGHYVTNAIDFNKEGFKRALSSLRDNGFIVQENDTETLAPELESAFLMLHQPDVAVSFKSFREAHINEVSYSFHSEFGIQYITDVEGRLNILSYPQSLPSAGSWIRKELFGGYTFEASYLKAFRTQLNLDELLVLFMMLIILKGRVMKKKDTLSAEECLIQLDDLEKFDQYDELDGLMLDTIGHDKLKEHMSGTPSFEAAVASLSSKKIVMLSEDHVKLTTQGMEIFNPGKVQDCIQVGEYLVDRIRFATINVMAEGYVILTPDFETPNNVSLGVEVCPSSIDIKDLIGKVAPVAFGHGFGDEKLYEQRMAESSMNK